MNIHLQNDWHLDASSIVSEGYSGTLFHDEPLFIGLEGILIVLAVIALAIGHPGFVFPVDQVNTSDAGKYMLTPNDGESGVELVGRLKGTIMSWERDARVEGALMGDDKIEAAQI